MAASVPAKDFEDVRVYGLDGSAEAELLAAQTECTFVWSEPSGQPLGVVMNVIHRRGSFWLTATARRPRIHALRLDPRAAVSISSKGSGIAARQSVTYAGTVVLHEDEATLDWFVPEFVAALRPGDPAAQESFATLLRSPGRLVLELVPTRRIGFDGAKMFAAAPAAAPSDG